MRFVSTRGQAGSVSFSEAVAQGLAPDGGLYLPDEFPDITSYLSDWENMSYPELCFSFFRLFASDIEENNLRLDIAVPTPKFTSMTQALNSFIEATNKNK